VKLSITSFSTILLLSLAIFVNLQATPMPQRTAPVAVGEMAPDFALQDQNGNKVALADVRGKSPVVLVFYRGYW
jgi:cytochrome oxidase Cu insertion factor (SCO1/SenC/PrrC family)